MIIMIKYRYYIDGASFGMLIGMVVGMCINSQKLSTVDNF